MTTNPKYQNNPDDPAKPTKRKHHYTTYLLVVILGGLAAFIIATHMLNAHAASNAHKEVCQWEQTNNINLGDNLCGAQNG